MAKTGSKAGVTTQDLLQPLQTNLFTTSSTVPAGFLIGDLKSHPSTGVCNAGGHQTSNNLVNAGVDMQPNYTSLDIGHNSKLHAPHDVVSLKHRQQQQNHLGCEALGGNKRLARGFSEDDGDEDDDFLDHGCFPRKEIGFHNLNSVQHQHRQWLEGKALDNKGLTSRSKHSATEQRRRSKINDRFQTLRQLLPNSDQKRDKASFLLEVVEYIKMLHEKVRTYEATEHQEGEKTLPWDRKSDHKVGLVNVSDGSSATIMKYYAKETPEANRYTTYLSTPVRVAQENGKINPDEGPSSLFASRLLPAPVCIPSYENTSTGCRPTFLSFAAPLSNSTEEPPTPTFPLHRSHLYPGGQSCMSPQLLHEEEQAGSRAKGSPARKEEVSAPSHLHQAGLTTPKTWHFSLDPNHELYKSPKCTPPMLCDRGPNEAVINQLSCSALKDVSAMRLSRDVEDNLLTGLNSDVEDKLNQSNCTSPEVCSTEKNLVNVGGSSAVRGGVINIKSPYSQGLLDTLTGALQTAGIDLAQARISVQIDLGKPDGSSVTSDKETSTLHATILPGQSNSATEPERPTKMPKMELID